MTEEEQQEVGTAPAAKTKLTLPDIIRCVQRTIAAHSSDIQDFRVEYSEDISEVKRELQQLRRNKVWIPREAV